MKSSVLLLIAIALVFSLSEAYPLSELEEGKIPDVLAQAMSGMPDAPMDMNITLKMGKGGVEVRCLTESRRT